MAVFSSPKLKHKFFLLQQQKKRETFHYFWRSILVSCLTGSLLWCATLPEWKIQRPEQIEIEGNLLVTEDTIHALLSLSYPQYIWAIPTKKLSENLESITPITSAKVTRQIFPSRLKILLQERKPVALTLAPGQVGFLDAQGIWIPANFYSQSATNFSLPTIKVVDFKPEYRSAWVEIYRLITLYNRVKIFEVRWQESHKLVLQTELGTVYFGSPSFRLEDKFKVLAQLKNLPDYVKGSSVAYIDLTNPDIRLIEKYPINSKISP
ncbi:MAG: FtsQ-type POTRA domain-containing protein [Stanieria sp.]